MCLSRRAYRGSHGRELRDHYSLWAGIIQVRIAVRVPAAIRLAVGIGLVDRVRSRFAFSRHSGSARGHSGSLRSDSDRQDLHETQGARQVFWKESRRPVPDP